MPQLSQWGVGIRLLTTCIHLPLIADWSTYHCHQENLSSSNWWNSAKQALEIWCFHQYTKDYQRSRLRAEIANKPFAIYKFCTLRILLQSIFISWHGNFAGWKLCRTKRNAVRCMNWSLPPQVWNALLKKWFPEVTSAKGILERG